MYRSLLILALSAVLACGGERTRRTPGPEVQPVPACGDGIIDEGEQCDGSNLVDQTCELQGFDFGTLLCSDTCQFVTSQCVRRCGNGEIDPGEACDGAIGPLACSSFGVKTCTAACEIDERTCVSSPFASGPGLDVDPGGRSVLTDLPAAGSGDLVFAVDPPSRLDIYRYSSPGGFVSSRRPSTNAIPLEPLAADLNADGSIDFGVIHRDGSASRLLAFGEGFSEDPLHAASSTCGAAEWVGLLLPQASPRLVALGCGDQASGFGAVLILQAGKTALTLAPTDPVVLSGAAIGDATLDGSEDVLVAFGNTELQALVETDGVWEFGAASFTLDRVAKRLSLVNLDGDTDADLVATNDTHVVVYERTATGFAFRRELTAGQPVELLTGDLDGDGRADLAWLDATSGAIEVRRNAGDFTFSAWSVPVDLTGAGELHAGDLDGDGDRDLLYTRTINGDGSRTAVFLNRVR